MTLKQTGAVSFALTVALLPKNFPSTHLILYGSYNTSKMEASGYILLELNFVALVLFTYTDRATAA
jgi:hypothetical protein